MSHRAKLLIIDDEEIVLDSCSQILEGAGFQITTASNGSRGLELLKESLPDLVFVDLKMPGKSGLEVLQEIRDFDPSLVAIVITGYATVSSAVEAMKHGAYDFLPKPFTPDELRLIAQRGLDRRRLVLETIKLRQEKEMLRENFAQIVSHELKAPLGAVQQNLLVLMDDLADRLTADERDRCGRMKNSIADLISLIHVWLRVLSVDVNKIQEGFIPIQVGEVIAKAVEKLEAHAARKDIEIVVEVSEGLPSVEGDAGTLVETVINIVGNAIKYSRNSSQIAIKAFKSAGELVISVADSGVGISKEDLPHIFNDFYSGRSTATVEKGSGIGLAVAQRIVEAHHGNITVETEQGKGSTFSIHLPFAAIKEPT